MLQVTGSWSDLRGDILSRSSLSELLPAWDDLCTRSSEENVYYHPWYVQALLQNVERNRSVRFAVVWEGAKLVALLPFAIRRVRVPLFGSCHQAWQTKYTFSCMPILDATRPHDAAVALLKALELVGEREWNIPAINVEGACCRAMIGALEATGHPWLLCNRFQRATLVVGPTFEQHMTSQVSPSRRRDLARNRRRLEKIGNVAHEVHCSGEGLKRAVAAFLKIEAGGWKGKRGTALACNSQTRQFAIDAFTGVANASTTRADVLTLNGAPIAVSLIAFAGSTGFTVKCAYDEEYRSYSAGLLLEVEVIRSFLSERWAARLDAATAGNHVIDDLWPGRIEVGDLMFSLSSRFPGRRLAAARGAAETKRKFRAEAKSLLDRFRAHASV